MSVCRPVLRAAWVLVAAVSLSACGDSSTDPGQGGNGGGNGGGLKLTDSLVRLTDDAQYDRKHPCWSSTGLEILYTRYEIKNPGNILISEIYSMSSLNGTETQLTNLGALTDFPSVKPAYLAYRSNHRGHFDVYYGGTNWETPVTNTGAKDFEVAVTPQDAPGMLALSKADSLHSGVIWNIYTLSSSGLEQVSHGNKDFHPSWSDRGTHIAFHRLRNEWEGAQIFYIPRYGGSEVKVTPDSISAAYPDWNRAYDKIAYASRGDIYMCNPDGSDVRQLTFEADFAAYPAWSPNGKYLAYVDFDGHQGRYVIFIKDIDPILTGP